MEHLKTGSLKNKAVDLEENYYMSKLDLSHLEKLIELQTTVMESMPQKDLYAGITVEELSNMLCDNGGVMVGAFTEEKLIGYYGIYFPGNNNDNLYKDAGINEELKFYVAHLEAAGVHPDYRGNSLQKTLSNICIKEALKVRDISLLCATVSPYNYPSIDHLFAAGLHIIDMKKKYGGMLRYICIKSIEDKHEIIADSIVEVENSDHVLQLRLMKDGFVGFRLVKSGELISISFGRMQEK